MASKLTKVVANFETSLASKLALGAVSGALVTATDKNGVALPAAKYCMIVDRGTGDEEHLLFDLNGTAITNIVSVSRQGVQTAGVQNSNGHRAGSKCYLTDFVNLKIIVDILQGNEPLDGSKPLAYDAEPTFNDGKQLIDKTYADTKASKDGANIFTQGNTFVNSPQVPSPSGANDAVNLAYVLALALNGAVVGFNKLSASYDTQGRIKNVRDNELGITYIISYDNNDNPVKIYSGQSTWRINYSGDRVVSITRP